LFALRARLQLGCATKFPIAFCTKSFTQVSLPFLFINSAGRLRSGWRLSVFLLLAITISSTLTHLPQAFGISGAVMQNALNHFWVLFVFFTIQLIIATLLGWACNWFLEELPPRALGWAFHDGWWRDLLFGASIGAASLTLAVVCAALGGGLRFSSAEIALAAFKMLTTSAAFFLIAAAFEEVFFRGYPLQTLMRSWPFPLALAPFTGLFALGHLGNPNAAPLFTFINTALAGIWLAVAYYRTRSLWFPLGVHWAWNWTQGPLFGLPVSGITSLNSAPVLRASDYGPAWLTGGAYGIEGGVACTIALILSTLFIWHTQLLRATDEMKAYTDHENLKPAHKGLTIDASRLRDN
jgi:membrane protease YdiL (CAAX protease family)